MNLFQVGKLYQCDLTYLGVYQEIEQNNRIGWVSIHKEFVKRLEISE